MPPFAMSRGRLHNNPMTPELPQEDVVLVSDAGGVRTLTLNRPAELNAVDDRVTARLQAELKKVPRDRSVRCLVLTGAGRGFCAGQDLKAAAGRAGDGAFDFPAALRTRYNPVVSVLWSLEIPTLAVVNGVAAGAGWSLALACDLRIASRTAKFVGAFSKIGLVPDSGMTWTLPRIVGLSRALEITWFGDAIAADTALQWGLVNRVVEPDQLASAAQEWASRLAQGATRGLGLTKRAMHAGLGQSLEEQLEYEAQLQGIAGQTRDYAEGVKAFIEKRPAEFTGE